MREIKHAVEDIQTSSGLSPTDAINVFLPQTLNAGAIPFIITPETKEALQVRALDRLKAEIHSGHEFINSGSDWISAAIGYEPPIHTLRYP